MPTGIPNSPFHQRFLKRIEKKSSPYPHLNECWIWKGTKLCNGYGSVTPNGKHQRVLAHRYSYAYYNGDVPEGHDVRHKCDVRSCVNPEHLETGTRKDNVRDMYERERASNGKKQLTQEQINDIRQKYTNGMLQKDIAKEYNLHRLTIYRVCNHKTYNLC